MTTGLYGGAVYTFVASPKIKQGSLKELAGHVICKEVAGHESPFETCCNHLKHVVFSTPKSSWKPPFASCNAQVYNVRIPVKIITPNQ